MKLLKIHKKESHKYVFMKKKKLLKQLIVNFQHSLPAEVYPRTLVLPTDSGKTVSYTHLHPHHLRFLADYADP